MTTTPDISEAFTDEDWDAADRITAALEAAGDLTPSRIARAAKVDKHRVYALLQWLVAGQYIHSSGNGARTHYHPGRRAVAWQRSASLTRVTRTS